MAGYGRLYLEQARCLAETPSRKSTELQKQDRAILKARCKELGARLLTSEQIQRLYPGGVKANVQNFYPRKSAIGMFPFEDDEDEAYS